MAWLVLHTAVAGMEKQPPMLQLAVAHGMIADTLALMAAADTVEQEMVLVVVDMAGQEMLMAVVDIAVAADNPGVVVGTAAAAVESQVQQD